MRLPVLLLTALAVACGTAAPEADPAAAPSQGVEATRSAPDAAGQAGGAAGQTVAGSDSGAARETGPRYVQAGAPGEESRDLTAEEVASMGVPGHSEADVRFMQGMIPHHAQAIEMVALMPGRTTNDRLLRLGGRIEISQRDEIALMARWLGERGKAVPEAHGTGPGGHGGMRGPLMPGMLTPEQMDRLAGAEGPEFDRLFLELMIGHHEGALVMVRELFSSPGGGQESWTFQFASDVDADQEMEIRRMRQMLDEMP